MDKKILRLALPSIVSNITVPLLGLVDVAIVGHLGAPAYIGAIAVGGMLFNIIYWVFGFLRMGTSGMTSQAFGRRDLDEVARLLVRAMGVGVLIALLLMLLQYPIRSVAFHFIRMTPEVERYATIYFHLCIWGAPAVLGLYGFAGWFVGMQNSRFPMLIAIMQNLVNIAASLFFVYGLGMKVEGVALGTLIAQYGGLLMAMGLWQRYYGDRLRRRVRLRDCLDSRSMRRFFTVNRDIFFRTVCLVAVTTFFASTGAGHGDIVLAVNTLLMQLFTLFSYIMDGFAYAGEALSGRYIGARNRGALWRMIYRLFGWGLALSLLFTLLYAVGGRAFLALLTDEEAVLQEASCYFYWVLAIPLIGFAAFLWDGILIGATATRLMLGSMAAASSCFFLIYYSMETAWGNHALWIAFLVYLGVRGGVEAIGGRKLLQEKG